MEFINPENHEEIIESVKTAKNLKEINEIIESTFPGWTVSLHRDYSADYPKLRYSWISLCKSMSQTLRKEILPKGVIRVKFIPSERESTEYSLILYFLNIMTTNGFIVRRDTEFKGCDACDRLIPSFNLYKVLKYKDPTCVPKTWDCICQSCKNKE